MLSSRGGGCPHPGAPQGFPALPRGAWVRLRSQTQRLAPCTLPAPAPNSPSPATWGRGWHRGRPHAAGVPSWCHPHGHAPCWGHGDSSRSRSPSHIPSLNHFWIPGRCPPGAEATPRTPRGGAEDTGTLPSGPEVTLRTLRLGLGRGRAQTSLPSRCEGGRRKAISYLCRIFRKPTCEGGSHRVGRRRGAHSPPNPTPHPLLWGRDPPAPGARPQAPRGWHGVWSSHGGGVFPNTQENAINTVILSCAKRAAEITTAGNGAAEKDPGDVGGQQNPFPPPR